MKKNHIARTALTLGLAATMLFSTVSARASETAVTTEVAGKTTATPTIARSRAWDDIHYTLGGYPASVTKMVYADCPFYLAPGVTEADFAAVIALGPKAVVMNTFNNGPLYSNPAYIVWNSDRTVLLVHPLDFTDEIEKLEAISVAPASGIAAVPEAPKTLTREESNAYMLTAEYTDAVRAEFQRLLNAHRAENGLRGLEVNLELQGYADLRAQEQRALFGHTRPSGKPAGSGWHNSSNIMGTRYAENIISCVHLDANPLVQAGRAFNAWKDSPGHNEFMLYDFKPEITMAFGIFPEIDEYGYVSSGMVFAGGY